MKKEEICENSNQTEKKKGNDSRRHTNCCREQGNEHQAKLCWWRP
jgi:hypothetical protein